MSLDKTHPDYEEEKDRFQHQPWYIKLWRYRYYILIPLYTIQIYFKTKTKWNLTLKQAWSIEKGMAQVKMNWLYSWEEVKKRLNWNDDDVNLAEDIEGNKC
jgi:hypothetical protein